MFTWNDEMGEWKQTGTSVYFFDELTRKTGNIGYRYDVHTGIRIPSYKTDYLYGNSGKKTGYLQYRWDENTETWNINQRIKLTYNDNGKLSGQQIDVRKGDKWQTGYRSSYRYNKEGFSQVFEKEQWNEDTQSWDSMFKTTYANDGKTTTVISYNYKNHGWVPVSKNIQIKNDRDVLSEMYYFRWNPGLNDWQTLSNSVYFFDAKGYKTEWISKGTDKTSGKQMARGHQLYHYDEEGKLSEVLGVRENPIKETVKNSSRKVYYWSLHALSGIKGDLSGGLKIYPNPFRYYTTVELPGPARRIDLLDTQGRVVRTYANISSPTLRIDKKNLMPAIYFIKVYSNKVYTARMMIY